MGQITITKVSGTYTWDVSVDGHRVDFLSSKGSSATIRRDYDFVVILSQDSGEHISEYKIRVGQNDNDHIYVKYKGTPGILGSFRRVDKEESEQAINSGCYVATSVYGSYDCPEVWALRRFRDQFLDKSLLGRLFIKTYYAISPTLVHLFGGMGIFQYSNKKILDKWTEIRKRQSNHTYQLLNIYEIVCSGGISDDKERRTVERVN